jgi:hypothetical protein
MNHQTTDTLLQKIIVDELSQEIRFFSVLIVVMQRWK